MNTKFAAIALGSVLSLSIGAAQAGELTADQLPWNQQPVASSTTRAQVQAERNEYLNATHAVVNAVYPDSRVANAPAPAQGKTRAEVKADRDYALSHKAPVTSPNNPYFG